MIVPDFFHKIILFIFRLSHIAGHARRIRVRQKHAMILLLMA